MVGGRRFESDLFQNKKEGIAMYIIMSYYDWLGVRFDQLALSLPLLALPAVAPLLVFHKIERIDRIRWYTSGFL